MDMEKVRLEVSESMREALEPLTTQVARLEAEAKSLSDEVKRSRSFKRKTIVSFGCGFVGGFVALALYAMLFS